MADIAKVLLLAVQDILRKPLTDMNRLRDSILTCLHPIYTTAYLLLRQLRRQNCFKTGDALSKDSSDARELLKQLQPQGAANHCALPD
jgi:two-component system response regulator